MEGSKKFLVYEFMSNIGSLADLLFKASVRPAWKYRVRFALDVARVLFYLHEECRAIDADENKGAYGGLKPRAQDRTLLPSGRRML
ncbi:hypothetical protein TIFTF001_027342 [Ficus carica]|uniref:Protein kinase domain-containing protein n=1 Tax=Ficus carica TaxID=3494 RepID=A0AA88DP24_FICCA|nr:hypothetical protein TIFTF001_027342 [Ficus carica]